MRGRAALLLFAMALLAELQELGLDAHVLDSLQDGRGAGGKEGSGFRVQVQGSRFKASGLELECAALCCGGEGIHLPRAADYGCRAGCMVQDEV